MIRDQIKAALTAAMKAGDRPRTGALRLVQSALTNRDIELRGAASPPDDEAVVTEVLQKMIKQRRESIDMYRMGGREELAEAEAAEVAVIEEFLPQQMDEAEMGRTVEALIAESGASSPKDMGRVMALLRERHAGQLDLGKASGLVKAKLQGE
ncbi:MAG: GatB/YqeY domain-containing protein [Sphingosinicella sp.]